MWHKMLGFFQLQVISIAKGWLAWRCYVCIKRWADRSSWKLLLNLQPWPSITSTHYPEGLNELLFKITVIKANKSLQTPTHYADGRGLPTCPTFLFAQRYTMRISSSQTHKQSTFQIIPMLITNLESKINVSSIFRHVISAYMLNKWKDKKE